VTRREIARVRSPASDLDAVEVQSDFGATTSLSYFVDLVPAGRSTLWGERAASLDSAGTGCRPGVALKWSSPSDLEVSYDHATRATSADRPVLIAGRSVTVHLPRSLADAHPCP
jgi:hypothetical protein